ncbi:MAG: hypothetical protein ACLFUI_04725 [Halanaerobiales bacterium]
MKVIINDEIDVFQGAKVKDAIRKYSMEVFQAVKEGQKIVVDQNGNQLSLDGELISGQQVFIKEK